MNWAAMPSSVAQLTALPRPDRTDVPGPGWDQRRQIAQFAPCSVPYGVDDVVGVVGVVASTDSPSRYVRAAGTADRPVPTSDAFPTIRDRPVSAFASAVRARSSVSTTQAVNTITTVMRLRIGQGMYALSCRQPHQPNAVMKTSWDR